MIKKIDSLDEVNQLITGDKVSLWDYEWERAVRTVSKNEQDRLFVIKWVLPMGENYVIKENVIDKFYPEEIEMFDEIIKVPKRPQLTFCRNMIRFKWGKPLSPSEKDYKKGDKGYNERFKLLEEEIKLFENSL